MGKVSFQKQQFGSQFHDRHEPTKRKKYVQRTPINGITDSRINQLIGSNLSHLTNPKSPFHIYCMFWLFTC